MPDAMDLDTVLKRVAGGPYVTYVAVGAALAVGAAVIVLHRSWPLKRRRTRESIPLGRRQVGRSVEMRMKRSDWWRMKPLVRFLTILCLTSGVTMLREETKQIRSG